MCYIYEIICIIKHWLPVTVTAHGYVAMEDVKNAPNTYLAELQLAHLAMGWAELGSREIVVRVLKTARSVIGPGSVLHSFRGRGFSFMPCPQAFE